MKLTPEQTQGIETLDRSLLLSAAAGSGKTAVLARRCAHIVCRSMEAGLEPCGVENVLVVTFTKAAAGQMRERIARRLAEELDAAEARQDGAAAARLRREIALLPRANISTLSSFCAGLVRRHFHAAGVDPHFAVLDDDQARLIKRQSARTVLDAKYVAGEPAFLELIDLYADGNDERLIGRLIDCHNLLTSVADSARWRRDAREQVREAATKPLRGSRLGAQLLRLVGDEIKSLLDSAKRMRDEAESLDLGGYEKHIRERLIGPAQEWSAMAASGDLAALAAAMTAYEKGRLPNMPASAPGKEAAQKAINAWKERVTKKDASILLRFSERDWLDGMQRIVEPTEQFLQLVEAFETEYGRTKHNLRSLDFADLERSALNLLLRDPKRPDDPTPSDVALYYQRQFHHVLVDEFQDINEVQDRLLRLLSRESAPPERGAAWRGNLFTVGDVKQSIYRFRLAEPQMFTDRAERAKPDSGLERIDLQTNFRSRGPLLAAINAVFARLMSDRNALDIDYADRHCLNPDPAYAAVPAGGFTGAPVELHVLEPQGDAGAASPDDGGDEDSSTSEADDGAREAERIEREATLVAQRIEAFKAERRVVLDESGQSEPFDYKHAAVLLRAKKFNSERFANVLRKKGVPCFSEVGTGFFSSLEVRDVLSLLRVLDNRRQDIPLAAVLRSPLVDLPDAEDVLARVRLACRDKDVPFFEAVIRYGREQDDAIAARLRYVLDQLDEWRRLAHRRPLAELLWHVYTQSGYLAYAAGLHDGEQRVANLLELHRRAGQFDAFQRQGLGAFTQFLESLEDAGEVGQPPIVSEADNVVRVMSVHAAKGLEFPVVFLADCGKAHNLRDTTGSILFDRKLKLAMQAVHKEKQVRYPSLVHELARRRIRQASLAEELRVLYVAMTRAKEHLICVGTSQRDAAGDVERWRRASGTAPLPAAEVLAGRSYLEWLGLAAAGRPAHFDARVVEASCIDAEAQKYGGRARVAAVPEHLAMLHPLDPPPAMDEPTRAAVRRLTGAYRFGEVTTLQAAVGVTSLEGARSGAVAEHFPRRSSGEATTQQHERALGSSSLTMPKCLDVGGEASAADVGTATHVALRHLDFRDAGSEAAVRRQIEAMVAKRQLDERLARRIGAASLAWLAGTELGQLLREHHDNLLRELPVRVGAEPRDVVPDWAGLTDGPLDRVLLRGQVDVVVPLESGLVIADYKTDRIVAEETGPDHLAGPDGEEEMLRRYQSQVDHYRKALHEITGRPVGRAYLVLLNPRRLIRL